jgi:hypothetical protein
MSNLSKFYTELRKLKLDHETHIAISKAACELANAELQKGIDMVKETYDL